MRLSNDCKILIKISLLILASFFITCEVKYFSAFSSNLRVLHFLRRGSCFLVFLYLFAVLLSFLFNRRKDQ